MDASPTATDGRREVGGARIGYAQFGLGCEIRVMAGLRDRCLGWAVFGIGWGLERGLGLALDRGLVVAANLGGTAWKLRCATPNPSLTLSGARPGWGAPAAMPWDQASQVAEVVVAALPRLSLEDLGAFATFLLAPLAGAAGQYAVRRSGTAW